MLVPKLSSKILNRIQNIVFTIETHQQLVVLLIIGFVIFSGTVYSISLGNTLRYHDERVYYTFSSNLVNKGLYSLDGIHATASRPPGYSLVLSFLLLMGANVMTLRIFNFVLLGASIFLLFKILQKSSGGISGLIAAFLIIFYPVLFYLAGTLYPQTLGSFLLLSVIYLVFNREYFNIKSSLLIGLIFGILLLSIPIFIVVLFVMIIFLILYRKDFKTPAMLILIISIIMGSWAIRNYFIFKTFVPFSTNMGINLLIGNSPNTTSNSNAEVDLTTYRLHSSSFSETKRDSYFRSEAIRFVMENKVMAIKLYFKKLISHFSYQNKIATNSESSSIKDLLMFLTYYPLLAVLIIRIFFCKRYPLSHVELFFIVIYCVDAFFQAIFFTRIRFRLPFDFLLIGVVASFMSKILKSSLKSRVFFPKWLNCK